MSISELVAYKKTLKGETVGNITEEEKKVKKDKSARNYSLYTQEEIDFIMDGIKAGKGKMQISKSRLLRSRHSKKSILMVTQMIENKREEGLSEPVKEMVAHYRLSSMVDPEPVKTDESGTAPIEAKLLKRLEEPAQYKSSRPTTPTIWTEDK